MPVKNPQENRKPKSVRRNYRPEPNHLVQVQVDQIRSQIMCTAEAAEELELTMNTVRKYCQDGCFPQAGVFGHEWLIPKADVLWWKHNRRGKMGKPSHSSD